MKTLVICGSLRFAKEMKSIADSLCSLGVTVHCPTDYRDNIAWKQVDAEGVRILAKGLTYEHFQRIRTADAVLIVNPDGYIGTSTTLEMGYAVALAKPMFSWEPDTTEVCRDILMISVNKNIENLASYLK